jgi:hypothetical protein
MQYNNITYFYKTFNNMSELIIGIFIILISTCVHFAIIYYCVILKLNNIQLHVYYIININSFLQTTTVNNYRKQLP